MALPKTIEGNWDEIKSHEDELRNHQRLKVIIQDTNTRSDNPYHANLSPEERIRQMDAFTETNRGLPSLPDEAFDREALYGNGQP